MTPTDDQVAQLLATIQESLDATGVYVSPAMHRLVDEADVARIEAAVARSPEPLYVVVHPFDYDDAFNGNPGDLLSRLHDASGDPGLYVANAQIYRGQESFRIDARAWGDSAGGRSDTYTLSTVAESAGPDDLGAQLVTAAEAVADGTVDEQYRTLVEAEEERDSPAPSGSGSGASDDGGGVAPVLTVVGVLVLVVVLYVAIKRAAQRPRSSRPREFALPASVLDRVREAHDQQLTRRAHREVLALGERIDAAELDADRAPGSWQAALDHYDAARRVLGEEGTETDVLDVVGALVLAERGDEALSAALAGRPFTPTTPCFLDPLHGAATTAGAIELVGDRVEVPLCKACREDLRKNRRPDILDVVRGGKPVHYFETDDEPWASTGYGALAPDLVERLHRRRQV
ncbi:hypothetical protein [Nocardioides sp. cx-173]|uniref:hypothetical protein n=1 Tax=Nocardioides sp. cx-173 TaxID=2898796 RepID=UPI001E5B587B|nr:hypothetical protein [Nocardioides sp. cx-173]MCD4525893.1 hypothetical protein [Nocardioides sp. cx-173]UGB40044.1 hypothetical protein LQ940_11595 [Nocardioides sp. cx-173]